MPSNESGGGVKIVLNIDSGEAANSKLSHDLLSTERDGGVCPHAHLSPRRCLWNSSGSLTPSASGCPCHAVNKTNKRLFTCSVASFETASFWEKKIYLFEGQPVL